MHKALEIMWETVDRICENHRNVWIAPRDYRVWDDRIGELLHYVGTQPGKQYPFPTGIKNIEEYVVYALLVNSVNYCYWYGWGDIRPNGSGAGMVAEMLIKEIEATKGYGCPEDLYTVVLGKFKWAMRYARLPMHEERMRHLDEMGAARTMFIRHIVSIIKNANCVERDPNEPDDELSTLLNMLEQFFPGYVSDMFLKRASLFFIDLFRCRGAMGRNNLFGTELVDLPVPADYHLPNILRHMGLLHYSQGLEMKIAHNELIPKGSRLEVEIRANTIKICRKLALITNVSAADVDSFIYRQRHNVQTPFHLTITTDY